MMTNLFSMFDPSNFYMSSGWTTPLIIFFSPLLIFYSKTISTFLFIKNALQMEFYNLTNSNLSNNFIIPLFFSILSLNLLSMIPSSFIMTAQMSIALPILMSLWASNILFFSFKKMNKMLTHMVPMGSPLPLIPIMVIIEIISNLIRPITLSVRLVANIVAGHLLLHLVSTYICYSFPSPIMFLIFPASFILETLEFGVALIQSYIACTLVSLYSSEVH